MKKINFDSINPTAKTILKTILFMVYMYGLVVVTPYLFDGLFSLDLFVWLKPVICVILGLVIYGPLLDKISDILDDDEDNDKKDK